MTVDTLTQATLKEWLSYDPETGVFRRLKKHKNRSEVVGSVWGTKSLVIGYLEGGICGRHVLAHRLVWLYVYGKWPDGQIDHIDGDRTNNRLSNLRDVSRRMNLQNRKRATSASVSGILGVRKTRTGRFSSRLKLESGERHIGTFDTPEEAYSAYVEAKRRLHPGNTL